MKTYQSKLAAGQGAWFMRDNKAVCMPVGKVTVTELADEESNLVHLSVVYAFRIYEPLRVFQCWEDLHHSKCFASKEELLASL